MTPVDQIAAEVRKAAIKKEGVTDLERRLRKIQKAAGGGRVQIALGLNGQFYAHTYPTHEQVRQKAREEMLATDQSSLTLHSLEKLSEQIEQRAMASGHGKTIDIAIQGLERFYGLKVH